jgi:23S rRNA maturation-related 3'-5' exoribonuclease YhaM
MIEYINKIQNSEIRKNVELAYNSLPEYFQHVPASSSGKYHPKFSLGEGGLIRHVKFACDIALDIFNITNFSDLEKDIILASLILHDGLKYGLENNGHTVKEHDDLMADYLEKLWCGDIELFSEWKIIVNCVRTHMGQWATTVKPSTKLEKFVHWCDYVASRKMFDKYYEVK